MVEWPCQWTYCVAPFGIEFHMLQCVCSHRLSFQYIFVGFTSHFAWPRSSLFFLSLIFFHLFKHFREFIFRLSLNQSDVYTMHTQLLWVWLEWNWMMSLNQWVHRQNESMIHYCTHLLSSVLFVSREWASVNEWANDLFINGFLFR